MLQLIKRCPEYAEGYKSYCQEAYDHNIVFFAFKSEVPGG